MFVHLTLLQSWWACKFEVTQLAACLPGLACGIGRHDMTQPAEDSVLSIGVPSLSILTTPSCQLQLSDRHCKHRVDTVLSAVVFHRVNPSALCIFISLWHIIVYAPMAHMVWHPTGLIRAFGVLDFAGECSQTCSYK